MKRPDLSKLPSLSRPPQLSSLPAPAITSETPAVATAQKLRIVLDAGHGGWDMGTIGRKGLMEKDLVLDVVSRLGKLITERLGAEVLYTRQNDSYVALEKRAEIANMAQANLFVSIHANYSSYSSARGVETYYTDTYSSVKARTRGAGAPEELQSIDWTTVDIREKVEESRHFAAMVQRALYGMLAAKTPGIRDRGVKKASYVVLNGTQHVEKRGIGRNLKVEVEETVNQDASNAQSCRERRSAIHVVHPFADLLGRPAINDDEKPEHHDKSEPSHLHQQLQVVIMRGVYKKIGIEAAKLRIYIRKHPQPPSYNRFKCEHLQPIASDVEPCSTRQLCSRFGSDTGHTPGQLASA